MGIIALAGFLACAFACLICGAAIFSVVRNFISGSARVWLVFAPIYVTFIGVSWYMLNKGGLDKQTRMDLVAKNCGWQEYKTARDIEGIYYEPLAGTPVGAASNFFLDIYSAVEYPGYHGEVYRDERNAPASQRGVQIDRRTFRYGIREDRKLVQPDIERLESDAIDLETGDILARGVSYNFVSTRKEDSGRDLLLFFVQYHPSGCGWVGSLEDEKRYRHVLQPKGVLQSEAYGNLPNFPIRQAELEILEREEYKPEKVLTNDEWTDLGQKGAQASTCKSMISPEYPSSPLMTFINDSSGKKRIANFAGFRVCNAEAIWSGSYAEGDRRHMVIEKYTPTGDQLYKLSFLKPDEPGGYQGAVMDETFKSENGYLTFEWWNTNQAGGDRYIKRRLKVRVKEPDPIAAVQPKREP